MGCDQGGRTGGYTANVTFGSGGRKPKSKTVRCTASVSFMSEKEISGCDQGGGRTGGYTKTKDRKVTFGSGGQKPNLKTVRCTASVSFMSEKEISGCDQGGGRTGGYTGDGALVVACDSCYFGLVVIK